MDEPNSLAMSPRMNTMTKKSKASSVQAMKLAMTVWICAAVQRASFPLSFAAIVSLRSDRFNGMFLRQKPLPEARLAIGRRRQLPGAGRRRANFRIDMHIEQIRLVRPDRVFECRFEILRLRHRYGL